MLTAGWVCVREVHFADPEEPARALAERMRERGVGALLVLDAERRPLGIVTDRDLVVRVLARGADPATTRCREVMSARLHVVGEETGLEDALEAMRRHEVRRLPVVDREGRLAGLLTLDDALGLLAECLGAAGQVVDRQSPHRRARLRAGEA